MILSRKGKQNNAGFTLVEMIVVLVILGILASAAVYGISAYIDMTRYNNNQQNAKTIYQSAQSGLNHMSENGTLEGWVIDLIGEQGTIGTAGSEGIGTIDGFDTSNPEDTGFADNIYNQTYFETFQNLDDKTPGLSAHMRYAVTFTPVDSAYLDENDEKQNELIKNLIYSDFKSTDIFTGIITIEFDVEKVLDTSLTPHYSASVYSVFYDSNESSWNKNDHRWDNTALNSTESNSTIVPYRSESYRRGTSLIGYYAGGNRLSAVDSVYLPAEAKIDNFTLRNGETLDLSWSLSSEDGKPITGMPAHIHYTFSLYDATDNRKFCDLAVNENSILDESGIPRKELYSTVTETDGVYSYPESIYNTFEDNFDKDHFVNNYITSIPFKNHTGFQNHTVVYTKESITDEYGIPMTVYRASFKTTTKVYVHLATDSSYNFDYNSQASNLFVSTDSGYYEFPLTVAYEVYDVYGATAYKRVTYTLSLDAMMARNLIDSLDDNDANSVKERTLNYSINRIMNGSTTKLDYTTPPKNFYAKMYAENDDFETYSPDYDDNYKGVVVADTGTIDARRALNDPIYLCSDGRYIYDSHASFKDTPQHAVVNAYFGDYQNGSVVDRPGDKTAVITSFRHLYNIRLLESYNQKITYSIERDLYWFKINDDNSYSSDVMVYGASAGGGLKGFSPVPVIESTESNPHPQYGSVLNVVSFPALNSLNKDATLIAHDNSLADPGATGDITSVINNVQMRNASFFTKDDAFYTYHGYGLISYNYGKIINVRMNGVTLILCNTPDGSPDDRPDIIAGIQALVTSTVGLDTVVNPQNSNLKFDGSASVGALVGANGGIIGDKDITDEAKNTVRATNCIVTSLHKDNNQWKLYKISAIACIVGDNGMFKPYEKEGYLYGTLETRGHFAVAGWIDTGGVIGYTKSDIDAKIIVNNTVNDSDPYKPIVDFGTIHEMESISIPETEIHSVIYATGEAAGGAIGKVDRGRHILQTTGLSPLNLSTSNPNATTDGRFNITERINAEYAINVQLDSGSFILFKTNEPQKNNSYGGIGGAVGRMETKGMVNIRVSNYGVIAGSEGTSYEQNVGGAIGTLFDANANTYNSIIPECNIFVINNGNIGTYDGSTPYGFTNTTGGAIGRINLSKTDASNNTITISVVNHGNIMGNMSHLSYANSSPNAGVGGVVGSITTDAYDKIPRLIVKCDNFGKINGTTISLAGDSGTHRYGIGGAIGFTQYLPCNSAFYSIIEESASVSSTGNNAGGAIGSCLSAPGSLPAGAGNVTITTDLKNQASIKSSASNAGGAIGNVQNFFRNIVVRTKISGAVTIEALSNAGGVFGRLNTNTTTINTSITLEGDTASQNSIKISASGDSSSFNSNSGGLIGMCTVTGGTTGFQPALSLPSQTAGNVVCVKVESSYDNAGGIIGYYKDNHQGISTNLTAVLHPESSVYSKHNNAGGCIGRIDSNKTFNSNIVVSNSNISSTSVPYIHADGENAGGLIGYSSSGMTLGTLNSLTLTSAKGIKIQGGLVNLTDGTFTGGNAGGCIGNIEGSSNINGCVYTEGNGIVINSTTNAGGVIGRCGKMNIGGIISTGSDVTDPADRTVESIYITGMVNTGGVIGSCSETTITGSIIYQAMPSNTPSVAITGSGDYTGGCIGYIYKGSIKGSGIIAYSGINADISGQNYTGGIIGHINEASFNNTVSVSYLGNNSSIIGLEHTGGAIGYLRKTGINNTVVISYLGINSNITGTSNTGGLFGELTDGTSSETAKYLFNAERSNITGTSNVGGIMGYTNAYKNGAIIEFKPVPDSTASGTDHTDCTIFGADNIGGIAGRVSSASNSGNLHKNPKITLENCTLDIIGNGHTGGIVGHADTSAWYSGGTITVNNHSRLFIQSKESAAGGNLGYLTGGNLGNSCRLYTYCTDNSVITIIGQEAAGGLIGKLEKNTGDIKPHIAAFNVDSTSSFSVTANGSGAGAGGIIGINENTFGRDDENITIPSGGGEIEIKAPSGYAGAFIGVNTGTVSATSRTYTFNVKINEIYPAPDNQTDALNYLFGRNTGTIKKFGFKINGSELYYSSN